MTDATKFLIISDNLIRYSQHEALDGSYLNAVIILSQIAKDVNRKARQGIISGEQASIMLDKIDSKKNEYIKEAKSASPRKFVYDSTDSQQKFTCNSENSLFAPRVKEAESEN